jgi:hypothetical protein
MCDGTNLIDNWAIDMFGIENDATTVDKPSIAFDLTNTTIRFMSGAA